MGTTSSKQRRAVGSPLSPALPGAALWPGFWLRKPHPEVGDRLNPQSCFPEGLGSPPAPGVSADSASGPLARRIDRK